MSDEYILLNKQLLVTEQNWNNDVIPLVSISCTTYNHENYIRDAIEGFLMQKTTFPIEILIHDDASTDKTADIVREYEQKYPQLIKPIYQTENQYSKWYGKIGHIQRARARGKYYAMCEGDDYWTDPYKLQKQVDFLEANEDYGLVHSELDHYNVSSGRLIKNHWKFNAVNNQEGDIFNSILIGENSMIYACTACFRTELVQNNIAFNEVEMQKFVMGDLPLWLHIASKSKIGYISDSMSVRNVLPYSATQGRNFNYNINFLDSLINVVEYFSNNYPVPEEIKMRAINKYYKSKMGTCFHFGEGIEIFDQCYNSLNKADRSFYYRIQRFGLSYKPFFPLIRFFFKVYNRLLWITNKFLLEKLKFN